MTELEQLQDKVEKLRREASKAEGAMDHLKQQLLKDFQCESIKAARNLLKRLDREAEEAETAYKLAMKQFRSEWPDLFKDEDE